MNDNRPVGSSLNSPGPRNLAWVGVAGLILVASAVFAGIAERAQAAREVAQWTAAQSIPNVSLATISKARANWALTLHCSISALQQGRNIRSRHRLDFTGPMQRNS